jgi:meiotic recombination protein SPO11
MNTPTCPVEPEDACVALEVMIMQYIRVLISDSCVQIPLSKHRDAFIAAQAHLLLQSRVTATKRDMYYTSRFLFRRQENANAAILRVAAEVGTHCNNLNIVAAQKGLVAGDLSFLGEHGEYTNIALFGTSGTLIPPRPERLSQITTSANFILVIEKETVFYQLANASPLLNQEKCILISGKGYPDFASRMLLAMIHKSSSAWIPTFVLTDADPHGLHIALVYSKWVPEDRFEWIGVCPSEYHSLLSDIPAWALLPITVREQTLAMGLLSTSVTSPILEINHGIARTGVSAIMQELKYLQEHKLKFEIEALVLLQRSPNAVFDYVMHKLSMYANSGTTSMQRIWK